MAKPLLGQFEQAFQYIQEFTGFFTPGITVIFLMGMFYKKTTAQGALAAAIGSAVLSFALMILWPELPFMDRVGLVFLLCIVLALVVSLITAPSADASSTDSSVDLSHVSFTTSKGFNLSALGVVIILTALYALWW
jgi:SSS family solute:Na+ symporter